ncbi:MAG: RNA-binding transcriptional accessory protein [Lachnospiraceae bacterium]|nr:RNA-binding transcriptional accessory protein [Lachnospiraceae bacterium]
MDISRIIADELEIKKWQTDAVIELIDEGNTIPFIARYRKEKHGTLNDEQLRKLEERLNYLRGLEERKAAVLKSIEEQGKLTDELKAQIENAQTYVAVEDLYRPYKQKRRTRAMIAKEKGLEPLAAMILKQDAKEPLEKLAETFISEEKGVANAEEALAGASDIIAEFISDQAELRTWIRNRTRGYGIITAEKKGADEAGTYANYYEFTSPVDKMTGFRTLALNRGEKEKQLTVRLEAPEEDIIKSLSRRIIRGQNPYTTPFLENAITDSYRRLIAPSIENEIRAELTEAAEDGAITVFGKNLTQYLMQPPIVGETVLGWDPAFRTGCKLAVVDPTGKVLDTAVIYPTQPTNEAKKAEAKRVLKGFISKYHVSLISVGNGTASRESEQFIVDFLKEIPEKVFYVITNEAGASVYSASKLATEEFPNFDVGQRSAVSIARRVQDPLAELVKIDPKAIGVGQYQHDMNQKKLGEALTAVVEDCVNGVGVDLNTASAALLTYVSGVSKSLAGNIVSYREEHGLFNTRKELLKVPKLGPKAFEQCAGFLRIRGGADPFDNTSVHPESYAAAEQLLEKTGLTKDALKDGPCRVIVRNMKAMADELGIGEPTLRDIIRELSQPGRDPREDLPQPVLRSDVLEMKDLKEGMVLKGTVRNIVDFGAFVDIGVHQDGLVHISRMSKKKFVKHPLDVVSIGDVVEVKVVSVDEKRKRIGLSMILGNSD